MNTWVLITLIICGTALIGILIYALIATMAFRKTAKAMKDFDKLFKL